MALRRRFRRRRARLARARCEGRPGMPDSMRAARIRIPPPDAPGATRRTNEARSMNTTNGSAHAAKASANSGASTVAPAASSASASAATIARSDSRHHARAPTAPAQSTPTHRRASNGSAASPSRAGSSVTSALCTKNTGAARARRARGSRSCNSRHSRTARAEYDNPSRAAKPAHAPGGTRRAVAATVAQPTKCWTPHTTPMASAAATASASRAEGSCNRRGRRMSRWTQEGLSANGAY